MKGQKYEEAKAGVDIENFGRVPYQEEEYYEYRNWLETYLTNHPNDADLSEEQLMTKFRNWQSKTTGVVSEPSTEPIDDPGPEPPYEGPVPGDPESMT